MTVTQYIDKRTAAGLSKSEAVADLAALLSVSECIVWFWLSGKQTPKETITRFLTIWEDTPPARRAKYPFCPQSYKRGG